MLANAARLRPGRLCFRYIERARPVDISGAMAKVAQQARRTRPPKRLSRAAVHEAGHAIVAWLREIKVLEVSVKGRQQGNVLCCGGVIFDQLMFLAAGTIAEQIYDPTITTDSGALIDALVAEDVLERAGLIERHDDAAFRQFWDSAIATARCMLELPRVWALVIALAARLMRTPTIAGSDLDAILLPVWRQAATA
jgi:hypothetical protein